MKMTNRELETRYMHMKQTWKTLVDANVNLVDENKDLKEEIERLNNIINELEKYLELIMTDDRTVSGMSFWYKQIYDYLQELKGSGSNV